LQLALEHHWKPQGTIEPYWGNPGGMASLSGGKSDENKQETWDGNYLTNDYQLITDEDAKNLCNALQKAIQSLNAGVQDKATRPFDSRILLNRTKLIESFLEFCEAQGFRIC